MNAGIPGLGLGGLFFILTALLAPAIELGRTIRGRSSAAAWATVGRQFAIAVAMIAAIELTLRGGLALAAIAGVEGAGGGLGITALPVAPLAITTGLLAGLIATAKCCQLAVRAHEHGLPARARAALTARPRIPVRGATAVGSACLSLLVGAAELGSISSGRGALRDPGILHAERRPATAATAVAERRAADRGALAAEATAPAGSPMRPEAARAAPRPADAPAAEAPGATVPAEQHPAGPSVEVPQVPAPADDPPAPQEPSAGVQVVPEPGPPPEAGPPPAPGPPAASGAPPEAGPPPRAGPSEVTGAG